MSITLYYAPQSNATRILWSLEELGVPYEKVFIDIRTGAQKNPNFLALNPNGKVPTIVLNGTPMFESVAIQIALGERYGVERGLWPSVGSPEHLRALSWLVWGQVTLGGALTRVVQNTSERVPRETHNAPQAELGMDEVRASLRILDEGLTAHPYLTGARFTLVDLDMVSVLGWGLHFAKVDLAVYPRLAAWLDSANRRPAQRAVMAST